MEWWAAPESGLLDQWYSTEIITLHSTDLLFHPRSAPDVREASEKAKEPFNFRNRTSSDLNDATSDMMPTSAMLVTIFLTTVLCELPNAILSVMSSLLTFQFLRNTYVPLGEVMDLLSLLSCISKSILYIVMSGALRKAFVDMFCCRASTRTETPEEIPIRRRAQSKDDTVILKATNVWFDNG